jgi:CDP-paratose 2-epimerase
MGHQVRDCLHPRDLAPLVLKQFGASPGSAAQDFSMSTFPKVINVSGGMESAMSLRQLSDWCEERFPDSETPRHPDSALPTSPSKAPEGRPFDLPWIVLDPDEASQCWKWHAETSTETVLEEIASFAETSPEWIDISA